MSPSSPRSTMPRKASDCGRKRWLMPIIRRLPAFSAACTIRRWESVRRGEERNIFPYQGNADAIFNSALVYELAVLQPLVLPLLRQVEPGTLEYVEAKRLMSFLEWIEPCSAELVPDNSILREFIGGSILQDYMPTL